MPPPPWSTSPQVLNPTKDVKGMPTFVHTCSHLSSGIKSKDVKGMPTFAVAMQQVLKFIDEARHGNPGQRVVLVAHNGALYDFRLLHAECMRTGVTLPSDWLFIDTRWLARVRERGGIAERRGGRRRASVGDGCHQTYPDFPCFRNRL